MREVNPLTIGWEKAVLGTALTDPASMEAAGELLPADFTGCHQALWAEILSLHNRQGLDTRSVIEALRSSNQLQAIASFDTESSGEAYLVELASYWGASMHEYATQVMHAGIKRELMKVSALIRADAEDQRIDPAEALDTAERRLLALRRGRSSGRSASMGDLISVFNTRTQGLLDGTITPAWVPRIRAIRDVIDYADNEDYILIAARPGEGKSSILRYEFLQDALVGTSVLMFNLENSEIEYAKWAIALLAGIDSASLRNPRRLTDVEKQAYRSAADRLMRIPFYVETMGGPSIKEVERVSRQYLTTKKVQKIGLDYVQLVRNGHENKVQDVSETSAVLRSIALNYKVPVFAAAQLSRAIEQRGDDAEPQLADLRESGSLEQDSTMVMFPRAIWKNPTPEQLHRFVENTDPATGRLYAYAKAIPIRVFIRKNRNGSIGVTEPFVWVKSTNNFRSIREVEQNA